MEPDISRGPGNYVRLRRQTHQIGHTQEGKGDSAPSKRLDNAIISPIGVAKLHHEPNIVVIGEDFVQIPPIFRRIVKFIGELEQNPLKSPRFYERFNGLMVSFRVNIPSNGVYLMGKAPN
jgi:hypothetical protein